MRAHTHTHVRRAESLTVFGVVASTTILACVSSFSLEIIDLPLVLLFFRSFFHFFIQFINVIVVVAFCVLLMLFFSEKISPLTSRNDVNPVVRFSFSVLSRSAVPVRVQPNQMEMMMKEDCFDLRVPVHVCFIHICWKCYALKIYFVL